MYPWKSAAVLVPLVLGFLSFFGFAWWEARFAKDPIIKKGVLNNWNVIASYIMTMFHGMILWSILYFLSESPPPPNLVTIIHTSDE